MVDIRPEKETADPRPGEVQHAAARNLDSLVRKTVARCWQPVTQL